MDMDFSKRLQGFDKVWQRVQQQKSAQGQKTGPAAKPGSPAPPPPKKSTSRAKRFMPGSF